MSWRQEGAWRPVLHVAPAASPAEVVAALDTVLKRMNGHPAWSLGPDLTVSPGQFREYTLKAAETCCGPARDRTWADFAAAFGCEATVTERGTIQDTALRTMSGAGHQHFIQFMQIIVERTTAAHLEKALFEPWRYDDPVEKQTLRWDPTDDVRRALRWRDPSGDPARKRQGGMLGANRLAIEGLPLLPSVPVKGELRTTGFSHSGRGQVTWTWPIWTIPLGVDVVRSLLSLRDLGDPKRADEFRARGIGAVYRSRRLTEGKFRSFTPGEPL
jgi:hypothetical protein